jgi:hypothetical protein
MLCCSETQDSDSEKTLEHLKNVNFGAKTTQTFLPEQYGRLQHSKGNKQQTEK